MNSQSSPASSAPTRVRWHIVALLMALCFISHMNRVSMSVAANQRSMEQYSISPTAMGTVYSDFLLVYTRCMTPGGVLIDRFGPRVALAVMGFGSALFGALTGAVGFGFALGGQALLTFILIRATMGFFTTPLHPASARTVNNWISLPQRSWANGDHWRRSVGIARTTKFWHVDRLARLATRPFVTATVTIPDDGGQPMRRTALMSTSASTQPNERRAVGRR